MSWIMLLSLIFFVCSFSISNGAGPSSAPKGPGPSAPKARPGSTPSAPKGPGSSDPNSIYKSFLECLSTQSPQRDPTVSSIVYSPTVNSTAYTKTLEDHIKNRRYNTTTTQKPVFIVAPTKEPHVQATVLCAKKLGVQIKIRSGGHDYDAVSYVSSEKTFIILDMFNLRAIDVNIATETAVAQAGALLGELYYRIWEKSKVHGFPAGACMTLGVGGHISGGGYGTMMRKYGLSVDHVINAKIVDVNGKIMDRKAMGDDLFWAIRGASGSSFGVILSFTIKLVSVPKITTIFKVDKTLEQNATDIAVKWQSIMPTIDPDLFIRVMVQSITEKAKKSVRVTFMALFLGDSNRLLGLMSKTLPELGLKKEECSEVSWLQATLFWANMDYNKTKPETLLDRLPDRAKYIKRGSDYVQTPIPKQGWTAIFNKLMELDKVGLALNPYGGKMSEIPANATPFPHRAGNLFKIQYSLNWEDPKSTEMYLNQAKGMYEFMATYVSKNPRGAFLNYRDFDIGVNTGDGYNSGKVYGEKYFKGNFERLVKIKTTVVDPDNFFRNEQSIPTQRKPKP
ncbi:berberine bridge enzyme-like 21 [Rutidosis leptorrhynchoides]|uniref:berberine bridge enzyme-like 21 n=1 Tax=Rutidosis leptorrhynchoides TaxID=125765 RepID=UPI003A9A1F2E